MSKYLVIGDSGHAEKVAGKESPDKSLREWLFNTNIDAKLEKRCKDHSIDYYRTNPNPKGKDEIGLEKRANLANDYWNKLGKPKALFISYHANAYKSVFNDARGTETFIAKNASSNSKNAAKLINDSIYAAIKSIDKNAKDRGVKIENYTVIYKAHMPSILLEYGFYTNKEDLKVLKNNQDDLVEATLKGICKYFDIKYKPISNNTSTTNETTYYRVVTNSYTVRSNAENEVKDLKKLNIDAFLESFTKDNKKYLRVIAGSYTIRATAESKLKELEKKGYKPFIAIYKK